MRTLNILALAYLLEHTSISEALSSVSSPLAASPLFHLRNRRYNNELNILGLTSSSHPSHSTLLSKSLLSAKDTLQRAASSSTVPDSSPSSLAESTSIKKKRAGMEELRKHGGIFSFDTPIGALNLYGIVYGVVAISLGLVWYSATMLWKLVHYLSGKRFDRMVSFCQVLFLVF